MKTDKTTLVIIAGAAGEIGTSYVKKCIENGVDVVGLIRNNKVEGIISHNFKQIPCSLDDSSSVERACRDIEIESYERIIFLHTIGVDKFSPRNYPNITKLETIDPDVYETNVNSFKYLLRYIAKRVATANDSGMGITMKTAIVAGVADKYTPFVIEDFCEAKLILRGYIRSYVDMFPEWFSGLSINITSTITKSALKVRPCADTKDWLTADDVVNDSFVELLSQNPEYKEIDIIKFSKNFIKGYYENNELLYKKWSKETGIVSPVFVSY